MGTIIKKITLSLLLFSAISGLSAQENDVREQILSYKDSNYDFVNKGRRLLIDHLQSFKIDDALNVKKSLLSEFDGNVSEVFYIGEYIHLLYWTGEFDILLNYLKQVDFNHPVSNNVRVSSETDNFYKSVFMHTVENKDIMELDIKNALLSNMERDFLLLLLNDIANPSPNDEKERSKHVKKVNEMADQFLSLYPDSPYDKIVRQHVRLVFKETDWGFYLDFFLGAILNQGDISRQFQNGATGGLLFEYRHRRMMGMLGFDVSSQKLKQDLPINNTIWKKESNSTLGTIYLNAGYIAYENRRWSIYSYMGVGYTEYSAIEKDIKEDEYLDKLKLNSFCTQLGVGIDLKISSFYAISDFPNTQGTPDSRISIKYTYRMPRFERKDPLLNGAHHLITLSYGIGGRGSERDM